MITVAFRPQSNDAGAIFQRPLIIGEQAQPSTPVVTVVTFKQQSGPAGAIFGTPSTTGTTPTNPVDPVDPTNPTTPTTPVEAVDKTAPVFDGELSITNVSQTGCTLSWQAATDNVGVTGYDLSIDGGLTYSPLGIVTSVTLATLTALTYYSFKVRARDKVGNLSIPLVKSVTTNGVPSGVTRYIKQVLADGDVIKASLSGLEWSFFEQAKPSLFSAPAAKGVNASTDSLGALNLAIPNSTLPVGGVGYLIVSNTNGTVAFAAHAFSGVVNVS